MDIHVDMNLNLEEIKIMPLHACMLAVGILQACFV